MKKHLLLAGLLTVASWLPMNTILASDNGVVQDGQTTEGKDFWVTFMQADQDPNNELELSLSISSREDCQVTIANPYTGYSENVTITANQVQKVTLYSGNVLVSNARTAMAATGKVCYSVNSEKVDTCALHVTATAPISLFATNYKKATFDATNVIPTPSLLDEYYIQTFTPSDHDGASSAQGSHFAIIATEDNTIVDYVLTVGTEPIRSAKSAADYTGDISLLDPDQQVLARYQYGVDTLHSPVLKKGQVYYIWTGKADNTEGDLSGSYVKARDGKKIAVFQGCPHTNIPYQVKQRDHIFSQAMPTQYWGNTFVLTASKSRPSDFIRIMALNDGTEVRINGQLVHTFNFATDTKHYWQFEIGPQGDYAKDGSCIVKTSCACAVHLFMSSQTYKSSKGTDGDPAMLWVNPIEQQIDQITFSTFASLNGTTSHYSNVVTNDPSIMTLDGNKIDSMFQPVSGSSQYYYAQISLGSEAATHTLKSNGGYFIAHVYGFTKNESYGYSAGGATKPLTQYITINGKIFTPDTKNELCGEDTVHFRCVPDFEFTKIVWDFGDGNTVTTTDTVELTHKYIEAKDHDASCCIYRESSNLCDGQEAVTCIPIKVTTNSYVFSIGEPDIPCPEGGVQKPGRIPYTSSGDVDLNGENVTIGYDDAAVAAGFDASKIQVEKGYFLIDIPSGAEASTPYGITLKIESDCGGLDTVMAFQLPIGNDVIDQRYNNVLALTNDSRFEGKALSDYQWYSKSDSSKVEGQQSAALNKNDLKKQYGSDEEFYVCYTINKGLASEVRTCACAKGFMDNSKEFDFESSTADSVKLEAYATYKNGRIFVNAQYGESNTGASAVWYNANGQQVGNTEIIPDGGKTIAIPSQAGLYILRVTTGKLQESENKKTGVTDQWVTGKTRSFKFLVNE